MGSEDDFRAIAHMLGQLGSVAHDQPKRSVCFDQRVDDLTANLAGWGGDNNHDEFP